ncbi:hypothetical protein CPB85DRAFT_897336 [Mucidula mucida]|nr:hypothetical protein CPB85DRAFT_897336 [Mucidula mucida]
MFTPFVSLTLALAVAAVDRATEAEEAAISDPNQECTAYYYAPISTKISSFPPIWQPATIVAGDTVAQDKWNSIAGSVPSNIQPRGTPAGNFTNVTYTADDPACWWTYHQCVTPKLAGLPADIATVPEPMTLGYGFDDGPNCSHNAFYDYLTEKEQQATMFYIGSNVMDWPLEAQRAVADGHQICVHTWSHRYMTALTSDEVFAELYYTIQAIKLATNVTPSCWRPPFGDVDDRVRAIANALGLQTIIWQYDSNDWKVGINGVTQDTVNQNYQKLVDAANSGTFASQGAIMLTHELNNYTMQTAMDWYDRLNDAFDYIVPIAVALNDTHPYAETNYTMPSFNDYINGQTQTSGSSSTSPSGSKTSGAASASGTSASQTSGAGPRLKPQWSWVGMTGIFVAAFALA